MFPQAQEERVGSGEVRYAQPSGPGREGRLWRGEVRPAHTLVLGLIVVDGVALLLLSFHFLHPGLHPLHSSLPKEKVSQSHSQKDVQNMGLAYRRLYQSILGAATDKQTMRQSDRRFLSKDQRGGWRGVRAGSERTFLVESIVLTMRNQCATQVGDHWSHGPGRPLCEA